MVREKSLETYAVHLHMILYLHWLFSPFSDPEKDYMEHRLLLGTHTSEAEINHLMMATVQVPRRHSPAHPPKLDEERGGIYIYISLFFLCFFLYSYINV